MTPVAMLTAGTRAFRHDLAWVTAGHSVSGVVSQPVPLKEGWSRGTNKNPTTPHVTAGSKGRQAIKRLAREVCSPRWQTFLISANVTCAGPWTQAFRYIDPARLQYEDYSPPGLTVLGLAPIPGNLLGQ